jgi:DNA polymerase-3 subunit gamma/tau
LLLYDDINRKGFEGDLVLNGFAEFIRNLLVCKDEKAAGLLEVVEGFRDKYIITGKKVDTIYLISSLNLLNEAEINYKAARNKRLHVELALIKLSYLQQAIELSANDNVISKKKTVESAKPVAFRNISPVEMRPAEKAVNIMKAPEGKEQKSGAKLIIENTQPVKKLEQAEEKKMFSPAAEEILPETASAPTFGALSKIRQQFANRHKKQEDAAKTLTEDSLNEAWKAYTLQLRNNKNSASQSFERAILRIKDPNLFEVITNNNLEQRFIEQEKRNLSGFLQETFNNRMISLTIIVEENLQREETMEKSLNKREQYQKIVDQYPLVKELKDRLKLELDY